MAIIRGFEAEVAAAAEVIAASPMIEAPKLPAECWHGLARAALEAAAPMRTFDERFATVLIDTSKQLEPGSPLHVAMEKTIAEIEKAFSELCPWIPGKDEADHADAG